MKAALVACVLLAAVGLAAAQPCLSTDGLAMIKGFEGFRSRQYKDSAGIWTIGYGTLCSTGTLKCPGPVTEAAAAAEMGRSITANYGPCVRQYVKAALNNNQYSALVSFAYNAGCGSLQNLAKVTNGVLANFPAHMVLYNKATVNGRLTVVQGLVNRRNAEVAMFRSTKATTCATRNGQVLRSGTPTAIPGAATVPGSPNVSPAVASAQDAINTAGAPFPVHPPIAFAKPTGLAPATDGRVFAEGEDTGKVNWVADRKWAHKHKLTMGGLKDKRNKRNAKH